VIPISRPAYLKVVRASAWYDLVVTALFATPWTFQLLHGAVSSFNQLLGGAPLPAFGPFQTMIASMMGTVVLLWSVLRLLEPSVRLGRFDGTGRFLFAGWMAWALLATGAPILWIMVIPEFTWGVIQWWAIEGEAKDGRIAPAAFSQA
jgi:hypothetical protein